MLDGWLNDKVDDPFDVERFQQKRHQRGRKKGGNRWMLITNPRFHALHNLFE